MKVEIQLGLFVFFCLFMAYVEYRNYNFNKPDVSKGD
jgi:hypothetical protein